MPILISLLCDGFTSLGCSAFFIGYSSSLLKKSRAMAQDHCRRTTYGDLHEYGQRLGGTDRPLFFVFALILLVQKRFCANFVQQQTQFISLILRTALIRLAFR